VKLPEHLSKHPYLIEYYGTVEWSVKAIFSNYMGWFSGKPSELHPLPYKEEAQMLADLVTT
jgi:alkyl sulfatase BDS1-like metallo-beta-lactamase superfamily hydrolase